MRKYSIWLVGIIVLLLIVGTGFTNQPSQSSTVSWEDFKGLDSGYYCGLHAGLFGTPTSIAQTTSLTVGAQEYTLANLFGLFELPFLLIAVYFAFRTAQVLRGGNFGRGMALIAAGALVMAVGHIHLQLLNFFDINIFASIFGDVGGSIVWFIALVITWGLTGAGFYNIYRASKAS